MGGSWYNAGISTDLPQSLEGTPALMLLTADEGSAKAPVDSRLLGHPDL